MSVFQCVEHIFQLLRSTDMCEAGVKCVLLSQHVSLQDKVVEELNNIVSTDMNFKNLVNSFFKRGFEKELN